MQKRNLGKSMTVSSVGLGCMGITHASGTPLTKAEGMKVLESALEIGYNFFDTAECYTGTNPDGTVAYNEEVAGTMSDLMKEGKIRAWGISETDEAYLRRAHSVCPVTAIQNRYSMMARWYENLFPVVEELGITYVAFSPLANGFLSGQYNEKSSFEKGADFRSNMPQYTPEGFEKSRELLQMLRDMAAEKNATPGQISLAWMLCKKPFIVPIPGSRKPERLKENFEAANICLSQDEIAVIDEKLNTMELLVFGGH